MRWRLVGIWAASAVTVGALLAIALLTNLSLPSSPKVRHYPASRGFDVSWPQCSGINSGRVPDGDPSYVILGLTDGAGHTTNPCLRSQLAWATGHGARLGAYLVASYPDATDRRQATSGQFGACGQSLRCELKNDGAAQAADALSAMHAVGLSPPRVWIDVEFRHTFGWHHPNGRNAAVIKGIVAGLNQADVPTGVYTTSFMWHKIVGNYQLNVPNWLPAGSGGASSAKALCGTTATGGPTWLTQYTRTFDMDLTCPALGFKKRVGHAGGKHRKPLVGKFAAIG